MVYAFHKQLTDQLICGVAMPGFDSYFSTFPPLNRAEDFNEFWTDAQNALKSIPMEVSVSKKIQDGLFRKAELYFHSFMRTKVHGTLMIPQDVRKPAPVIVIHDYNSRKTPDTKELDPSLAWFFLTMRGHDLADSQETDLQDEQSPGYLIENILDRGTYYLRAVYLDVLRSVDALRLVSGLNCSRIGIIGKGLGAAAGICAASLSDRVAALVLETPSFCYLDQSQNQSIGDAAREINNYISSDKHSRKKIKQNLSYFDAMNFADMVQCPVMATAGFKDQISTPESVFALFNHFRCEKVMEVYPEEGNTAGGIKQFRKETKWIKSLILEDGNQNSLKQ